MADNEHHIQSVSIVTHLKNIAWSCWYVIEDLWKIIAPTIIMIAKLIWRILKPSLNWLWVWVKCKVRRHPAIFGSMMLHVILIFMLIGVPSCSAQKKLIIPKVITVELLPIKQITNVKPVDNKPVIAKVEQSKPSPRPPVKRVSSKPKMPRIYKPKIQTKPVIKPKVKPQTKPKTRPKVKNIKKPPLIQPKPAQINKLAKPQVKPKVISQNYDRDRPLSMSEIDSIRNQLISCWRILPGARAAAETSVIVRFKLNKNAQLDGQIAIIDSKRYNNSPVFKAAADNAIRAIHRCSPLKNLPKAKYQQWKEMEFNFDPADMY